MPSLPSDHNNSNAPESNDTLEQGSNGEDLDSLAELGAEIITRTDAAGTAVDSAQPGPIGRQVVGSVTMSGLSFREQTNLLDAIRLHPIFSLADRVVILQQQSHILDWILQAQLQVQLQTRALEQGSLMLGVPPSRPRDRETIIQRIRALCNRPQCQRCYDAHQRYRTELAALPTSPVLYDVPYDKLVGPRATDDVNEPSTWRNRYGRTVPRPERFSRTHHHGLSIGMGHRYITMDNRALVETRQALSLAGLDTSEMDLAITQRVLRYTYAWGCLGSFMDGSISRASTD